MSEPGAPAIGFFAELRRRRVLRTLALYIVGAWVLMQVADVVFPALDIPEQAIRYLLFAAVGGFPVALVFAWLFNITPEGIRRTGRLADDSTAVIEPLRGWDYAILGVLGIVLGVILYGAIDRVADAPLDLAGGPKPPVVAVRGDGPPMVAVLPFTFRGAGDDAAFFAAGVHDDLLTQLSQLSGLRVISRTSVLQYQDTTQTIPAIGSELGADVILEGGVQLAGGQIRINAQLIDVRTDEHLWASTFDRKLTPDNLFIVQGEIARAIATALDASLTTTESTALDIVPTDSLAAYRAFHESQRYLHDQYSLDPARGIALLETAIEQDPRFVKAMVELVYALSLSNFGGEDAAQTARVEKLVETIGELAPDSIEHLIAQGYYAYYILRDYDTADRLLALGRDRAPSNMELVHIHSWIKKRQGDFDAWIDLTYLGRRLEPNEDRWIPLLVYRLATVHRYDEALQVGEGVSEHGLTLAMRLSRLRILRHHDLRRARDEMVARAGMELGVPDLSDVEELFLAQLSVRDYAAARALVEELPDPSGDAAAPSLRRIPAKLRWSLTLHRLSNDETALDAAVLATRRIMGLDGEGGDERLAALLFMDRLPLALAAGEADRARAALDEMGRLISDDIAPMLQLRPVHCRGLAALGDAVGSVRCLRLGIRQPSEVMPFFEPLLPHYDGIRATAEFRQLLQELASEGWLEAQAHR